jgi:hypothetical protein
MESITLESAPASGGVHCHVLSSTYFATCPINDPAQDAHMVQSSPVGDAKPFKNLQG